MFQFVRLTVFATVLSTGAHAASNTISVEVNEDKKVAIARAHGVILDKPEVAEIAMIGNNAMSISGRRAGNANIDVITADGKRVTYALRVADTGRRPTKKVDDSSRFADVWEKPQFGGLKLAEAQCALSFSSDNSLQSFEKARDLLRRSDTNEAVILLEELVRAEPNSATSYLFLGAAYAHLGQTDRGTKAYETFALSCPDDPRAPSVVRMLKQFSRARW